MSLDLLECSRKRDWRQRGLCWRYMKGEKYRTLNRNTVRDVNINKTIKERVFVKDNPKKN